MGLVAHYKLEGNANAEVGSNGTATSVTYTTGINGQAGVFGSAANVAIASSLTGTNNFAVSLWAKITDTTANITRVLVCVGGDGGATGWYLRWRSGVWTVVLTGVVNADGPTQTPSGWTHAVYVRRSGSNFIYINGVEYSIFNNAPNAPSAHTTIGALRQTGSYLLGFPGHIDDVRFYDHGLTSGEVTTIYNEMIQTFKPHFLDEY